MSKELKPPERCCVCEFQIVCDSDIHDPECPSFKILEQLEGIAAKLEDIAEELNRQGKDEETIKQVEAAEKQILLLLVKERNKEV